MGRMLNRAKNQDQWDSIIEQIGVQRDLKNALEIELNRGRAEDDQVNIDWEAINNKDGLAYIADMLVKLQQEYGIADADLTIMSILEDYRAQQEKAETDADSKGIPFHHKEEEDIMFDLATRVYALAVKNGRPVEEQGAFISNLWSRYMIAKMSRIHRAKVKSGEFEGTIEDYLDFMTHPDNEAAYKDLLPPELKSAVEAELQKGGIETPNIEQIQTAVNAILSSQLEANRQQADLRDKMIQTVLDGKVRLIQQYYTPNEDTKGVIITIGTDIDGASITIAMPNPNFSGVGEGPSPQALLAELKKVQGQVGTAGLTTEQSRALEIAVQLVEETMSRAVRSAPIVNTEEGRLQFVQEQEASGRKAATGEDMTFREHLEAIAEDEGIAEAEGDMKDLSDQDLIDLVNTSRVETDPEDTGLPFTK